MNLPLSIPCLASASLEICLPSTRASVNTACETVQEFLRPLGAKRSPNVEVVLRELLLNAVTHGNSEDASRLVRCRVAQVSSSHVQVQVGDEGGGFSHERFVPGACSVDHPRDRHGYDLICALSDRLEFSESGNVVTAYVCLKRA